MRAVLGSNTAIVVEEVMLNCSIRAYFDLADCAKADPFITEGRVC